MHKGFATSWPGAGGGEGLWGMKALPGQPQDWPCSQCLVAEKNVLVALSPVQAGDLADDAEVFLLYPAPSVPTICSLTSALRLVLWAPSVVRRLKLCLGLLSSFPNR